jgi:hypothetical protein
MSSETILQACREAVVKCDGASQEYIDRGTLPSENLLICAACEIAGARAVIESGRFRGHSTKALAEFFHGQDVVIESVDLDKRTAVEVLGLSGEEIRDVHRYAEKELAPFPNVKLHYGNAFHLLGPMIRKYRDLNQKVALFIDGPKEKAAVDLAVSLLLKFDNIAVVMFHDCPQGGEFRKRLESFFQDCFFSDAEEFVGEFAYLDNSALGPNWQPYQIEGKAVSSYGYTVGVVFPRAGEAETYRSRFPEFFRKKSLADDWKLFLKLAGQRGIKETLVLAMRKLRRILRAGA